MLGMVSIVTRILLNILRIWIRTLAVWKRSSGVWKLLDIVKTVFSKFGNILDKTQKKFQETNNTIGSSVKESRARKLSRKTSYKRSNFLHELEVIENE